MYILCNSYGIVDAKRPGQGVLDIAGAGFENLMLDLTAYCSCDELEHAGIAETCFQDKKESTAAETPEKLYDSVRQTLERCSRDQLKVMACRAPYLFRDTKRLDLGELLARLAEESIRICGRAGGRFVIIRPLTVKAAYERQWEINQEYYLRFAPIARENNLMILLENQCRDVNGHSIRGICADGRQAAEWVDRLNEEAGEERFGFCMDTGACSLCGQNMHEFAFALGNRIKAVILRESDRQKENAMLPFTNVGEYKSKTNWLELIRGLRETGFDGWLILNAADTAAAFSPILRPQLMRLAKSVADYFKWQIEIENLLKKYHSVVLFGAGNMCRNYMKCYGKKYPPLYTCDNNQAVWGTRFCGLEVKPPEQLKKLPEDCAVFICNIYYREIERQLRDMGVHNPIEFFNDEYMPSFYFDRLKDEGR